MKRIDIAILVVGGALGASIVISTALFRGNVDEWGAGLEKHTQEKRALATALRDAATSELRENPDGFYKLELRGQTVVRYYVLWRIWTDPQDAPAYVREKLAASLAEGRADAVAEAASATIHLISWRQKDRERLSGWLRRRGVEGIEVELFAHFGGEGGAWRAAGAVSGEEAARALGDEDVAAVRKSRFNRLVILPAGAGP
ncbi:MAG: hypothetical protein V2A58_12965 [Planctomycetota bacterium]